MAVYVPGIIAFTREVNLPLNAVTESWDAARVPLDWAQTRDAWNDANMHRVWLAGAAFVLALSALVVRSSTGLAGAANQGCATPIGG